MVKYLKALLTFSFIKLLTLLSCLTHKFFSFSLSRRQCASPDFLLPYEPQHHDSKSKSDNCHRADHPHQCRVLSAHCRARAGGGGQLSVSLSSGSERLTAALTSVVVSTWPGIPGT